MFVKIKARILVASIIVMVITLLTQSSLAYYSSVGSATNVVTSGKVSFMINETTEQGTPFPENGVYIVPGDIVSKRVTITSVCEHPFYLRVKLVYGIDSEELSAEDCFKLNINGENWKLVDGWYYYTGIVQPGDTTPQVFSHVEIVGSKMDNNYLGKTLKLSVKAQAVQSENNPIKNGETYTASGWPKE